VTRRTIASLATAMVIAVVAVGCGGGSDNAFLSKAEYIKQADLVCGRIQRQIETEFGDFIADLGNKEPASQQASEAAQSIVANEIYIPRKEQELEGLKELRAPRGDEARVEKIIGALEDGIEATEKDPGHAVTNSAKAFSKEQVLATKYGLTNC
jgi:hypothetical protein